MDPRSASASVIAVATAGNRISLKLIAFADQVGTSTSKINAIGTDASVTSATLQGLGELIADPEYRIFNDRQFVNITASAEKCQKIFNELHKTLRKASQQLRNRYANSSHKMTVQPLKLSKRERLRWPFLQPAVDVLCDTLRHSKGTLALILQVAQLHHAQATAKLDRDEQIDIVRVIAAMKRRLDESAKYHGTTTDKSFFAHDDAESDLGNGFQHRKKTLKGWSVKPDLKSAETGHHFHSEPLPLSQECLKREVFRTNQSFEAIINVLHSLSPVEHSAIFDDILQQDDATKPTVTILLVVARSWAGIHSIFGEVKTRSFTLIVEDTTQIPTRTATARPDAPHRKSYPPSPQPKPQSRFYPGSSDSSDSDPMEEQERAGVPKQRGWERRSSPLPQRSDERVPESTTQSRREDPVVEVSDEELVRRLLIEYTTFDARKPVIRPDEDDEPLISPGRNPRPY